MPQNKSISDIVRLLTPQTLVVLDIDSSILLTHPRNQAILRQFAVDFATKSPEFCQSLSKSECFAFEYGYYQALGRLGPIAEEDKKSLATYWRTHFFSNNYLHHDVCHDGALEFVEFLSRKNIPFLYLTGRPEPLMWDGTKEALQKLGFPVRDDQLFLKPQASDVDEIFKTEKMRELKKSYSHVVFIDNEPKVLNQIDQDHPDIDLVFVDTCHSPNVFPPPNVVKIRDFRELVERLK